MISNKRNLLKYMVVAGATATIAPNRWIESVSDIVLSSADAQSLPDSYIGSGLKADYINQLSPSPIDFLVPEVHASHLIIPNPWHILATKNGEDTYQIEILDPGSKALRMGTFNINGDRGEMKRVDDKSCEKLRGGEMTKAFIYGISPEKMVFQTSLMRGVAKLQWKLVPGVGPIPATECT